MSPKPPEPIGFPSTHCFLKLSVRTSPSGSGGGSLLAPFGAARFLAYVLKQTRIKQKSPQMKLKELGKL